MWIWFGVRLDSQRPSTIVLTTVITIRSDYLRRELTAFSKVERNVFMIPEAFDTIWAGSGLMEMYTFSHFPDVTLDLKAICNRYLSAIKYMLRYEWDHFINLSEVDFPVVNPREISRVLRQKRGYSFLNANFDKSVKGRMEAIQRQVGHAFSYYVKILYLWPCLWPCLAARESKFTVLPALLLKTCRELSGLQYNANATCIDWPSGRYTQQLNF